MPITNLEKTRINNAWPVAREGIPFILIGLLATVLFFSIGLVYVGLLFGILTFFILYFFRDPERSGDDGGKTLLAPADGKILGVWKVRDDLFLDTPVLKISIFMSVFNVHVNRIPIKARILQIIYNPGKFFSANLDKASELNEKNIIISETGDGRKIAYVQIAGLIARRIVCWIKEKDYVTSGQRFGLIKFGSRVDIYIPEDSKITVQAGQKVKAGESILGYLS